MFKSMNDTLPQAISRQNPAAPQQMKTLPHCQICRSQKQAEFSGAIVNDPAGSILLECPNCGYCQLYPMPEQDAISDNNEDRYGDTTSGYFTKIDKKIHRARGRVKQIKRFAEGGKFIDVGCSGGFMTEAAREAGFDASGIEPSANTIDWAQEHYPLNNFVCGTIEADHTAAGLMPQSFDVAYCSEVIEHVADPNIFLSGIARLLKRGGVLFLTTPDVGHFRRPRDINRWDVFTPPHHCAFFTRKAMGILLEQHGFRIIGRRPAFKPGIKVFARKIGG